MFTKSVRRFAALAFILTLGACAENVAPPAPQINYDQYGVQRLNVERIRFVNDYRPPAHEPNVEHQFVVPPYFAAQQWAQKHYQAVGNIGQATIRVVDAKVVHVPLPTRQGVESLFYNELGEKLEARLVVRLEVESPKYENIPYAEAEVVRSVNLPEDISQHDREQVYQQLTIDLITELNRVMQQSVQRNMPAITQP